jgi:diguanylate cyclase (GGDEF)-like protein
MPDQRVARVSAAHLEQERFMTRLSQSIAQARTAGHARHALLAIDRDAFTRLRASAGTDAADELLATVGRRLRECLGSDDEMMQVGEDEFHVLVACDGNAASAWQVAELMQHVLAAPYVLGNRHVAVTVCIGIALVQPHHVGPADVSRDAFAAVHRAKSAGSARCALFHPGMHETTYEQLHLAAELRTAIDRGEFRMYYQPILCCRTGAIVSLEALIRWQHPARGCLPPSEFLDALNRGGLMTEVGRWIVGEVARQSVEWRVTCGLVAPIAINVSPRQLADAAFVAHVLGIVDAAGAGARDIHFEVTEDIELGTGEAPVRVLRDLRSAGFRVRIDDFGTGYSSLSYLPHLPVDGIKIDRTFLDNLEYDPRRREVVSAIIRLAHVLDLDVVAEGVERREQLDALQAMGCDQAQGHFLSPPLPAARMRAWLGSQR